jgi:uncharacterized protein with ParB-like and HNH nuclease domain
MSGFQSPITIRQAIDRINRNEFLLPSFQREFVWRSEQIEKLFDSLMKGYPISSMLFWKVKGETKTEFRFYKFLQSYIEKHQTHNELIGTDGVNDFSAILDGQQRLTALYIGLCGSYASKEYKRQSYYSQANYPDRHLYLNLSSTYNEEESDSTYKFYFWNKADTSEVDIYVDEDGEKWFKVGRILSLKKDDTLDDFLDENTFEKEEKKLIRKLDRVIHTEPIINFYEEEDQAPDKAVNIFVRINSGGTSLGFSDILLSIAVANWKKDARTEILGLVDQVNEKGYSISKDYILKAFLFLYHKDVRFQITSFKNDFITKIETNWENIRNAILSVFETIQTFGLNGFTLTTNNATLPILYYIYHRNIWNQFATKKIYEDDRLIMRKWLFNILVRRTFGGQGDTVLTQARKAFIKEHQVGEIDEMVTFPASEVNVEIKRITEIGDDFIEGLLSTQKDSQYSFPILALLYPNLDYKNNNFHQDHLHPAASYDDLPDEIKQGYGWGVYNSILNLQMLDANENMSKNAGPLEIWVESQTISGDKIRFLNDRLIPGDTSLMLSDFAVFIERRKGILIAKLKELLN